MGFCWILVVWLPRSTNAGHQIWARCEDKPTSPEMTTVRQEGKPCLRGLICGLGIGLICPDMEPKRFEQRRVTLTYPHQLSVATSDTQALLAKGHFRILIPYRDSHFGEIMSLYPCYPSTVVVFPLSGDIPLPRNTLAQVSLLPDVVSFSALAGAEPRIETQGAASPVIHGMLEFWVSGIPVIFPLRRQEVILI
jgi:hypothetical protein